jgi:hypothetical protein
MKADIPFWWNLVPAARATLTYLGANRLFVLLLIEAFCAVVAWRAYHAPQGKRLSAIRSQWLFAVRDVFVIFFSISIAVFGYELMWNQPKQSRLQQFEYSRSNPSVLFNPMTPGLPLSPTSDFLRNDSRPICVQVRLPQDFPGGSYQLPYKAVPPSPPALYDNGSAKRKGIDYTVSDSTIVVNFRPASKDSLSVWYTTNDPVPRISR